MGAGAGAGAAAGAAAGEEVAATTGTFFAEVEDDEVGCRVTVAGWDGAGW